MGVKVIIVEVKPLRVSNFPLTSIAVLLYSMLFTRISAECGEGGQNNRQPQIAAADKI